MKKILIFGGTSEARKLSECLIQADIFHIICVATDYGKIVLKDNPLLKIHKGRMNEEEIRDFISAGDFLAVVDASHPYAKIVSENIKNAMKDMDIPYLRLKREDEIREDYDKIQYFSDSLACAKALKDTSGNILLTTGSKELHVFSNIIDKEKLYIRILPSIESLKISNDCGISGKQILALQGPFTKKMNQAILDQYKIKFLVTKESGKLGGYQEKIEAAKALDIPVFVISAPKESDTYTFEELLKKLEIISKKSIKTKSKFNISLVGIGMGEKPSMTIEVDKAIKEADIILGAERIIKKFTPSIEKMPYYSSEKIIPYLENLQKLNFNKKSIKIAIIFSGDVGFYSGCKKVYQALQKEIADKRLEADIKIFSGISSISYLAAKLGENYHDIPIYSIHGKKINNLVNKIISQEKIFMLVSGLKDIHKLANLLLEKNLSSCKLVIAYNLSYPEEKIRELAPIDCLNLKDEGLYTCLIKNPNPTNKILTPGIKDHEFIRDKVPMTKEEIRDISICKLKLEKNSLVYDIGSGTGSIAVEIARLSDQIEVFAIEKKDTALALIDKNKEKFNLDNIEIIKGEASEILDNLPTASHAFIGGSSGNMENILTKLYQKNPNMRIVINAISLETIYQIKEILSIFPIKNEDIVQVQVSRSKKIGSYHLMNAENPVWIFSFNFSS